MKKFRGVFLKNDAEISLMREANRMVSVILDELGAMVAPGMATMRLEEKARQMCDDFGVAPAFLGYNDYPFALCCSVNEQVVHGFPSETRVLKEGDIVSCDMGVIYKGFYGDSARTFPVGAVTPEAARLMDVTKRSLEAGIAQAKPGNVLQDVSRAVQELVEAAGFGVVRRFVGHGIGRNMHEKPEIPNYVIRGFSQLPLKPGMCLAIEPMVTAGAPGVEILEDKWTAITRDGSLAAHFEHTIAVTHDGPRVLSVS